MISETFVRFVVRARCRFPILAVWALQFGLAACSSAPPPATVPSAPVDSLRQLQLDITGATHMTGTQRATWGIAVHSLARNQRLFELNERSLLVPASAAKLITVAAAADATGWNYRFETTLRATGPVADGVLQGDLLIVGSGDPSIGGRGGDDLSWWIDALKNQGIRRIDGRIVGDDDAIEEPRPGLAWAWDDLGYTTGALFGALNLAENRVRLTISPGPVAGATTSLTVDPDGEDRPLINRSVTGAAGSSQLLWPEQRPGETKLTIAGSIPVNAQPATLFVAGGNPTLWFASVLRRRLIRAGIEVTGAAVDIDDLTSSPNRDAAAVLYTYRSHTLAEIAQPTMKASINLYGEALLRLQASGQIPKTNDAALAGLRQRVDGWGIPTEDWQLIDGSGLSRRDVVTPTALVAVLQRGFDASGTSPWMTALPIAGRDGTLEDRMKNTAAEGNVHAKTGTMSNVRALAGYVRTRDSEPLAFAIIVNNFEGTGAQALAAIDSIAVRLATFSRSMTGGRQPDR